MVGSNAAPSHSYVKAVNESGGILAAKNVARPSLDLKGPVAVAPPPDNKAAAARLRANMSSAPGAGSVGEKREGGHIRFDDQGLQEGEGGAKGEEELVAKRYKGDKDTDVSSAIQPPQDALVANEGEGKEDLTISLEAQWILDAAATRAAEAAAELKTKLEEMSKEKSDMFDVMIEAESRIRLDEQGVRQALSSPHPPSYTMMI